MPRSPRTKLTMRRERLLKQIKMLELQLRLLREDLEETSEIIRVKGPFTRPCTRTRLNLDLISDDL